MKLDLRGLLAGERLLNFEFDFQLETDQEDTSSFLYGVRFPSPMKVVGDITNTAGYMKMTLSLSVNYETLCARCLSDISGEFSLDLEKTVAPRNILEGLDEDKIDDYAIIENGFLDMDELIYEQLELEFPSRFLCREDCRGLCQRCGKNLNLGKCECPEKEIDPRFAPLQKLLDEMKK